MNNINAYMILKLQINDCIYYITYTERKKSEDMDEELAAELEQHNDVEEELNYVVCIVSLFIFNFFNFLIFIF